MHASYMCEINFVMGKASANQWSINSLNFSTSRETEFELELPKLNVIAHNSVPFHMTTKKSTNDNVIFGREIL